jgi:hypothetical protein
MADCADLRNAASAGKRAVRAEHLAAEVAKKGEEELDTTFKATQVRLAHEKHLFSPAFVVG